MTNQDPCKHLRVKQSFSDWNYCYIGTCLKCGLVHEENTWEAVRIAFGRAPKRKFCRRIKIGIGDAWRMECHNMGESSTIEFTTYWRYCPYCGLKIKGEHDE